MDVKHLAHSAHWLGVLSYHIGLHQQHCLSYSIRKQRRAAPVAHHWLWVWV